MIPESVCGAIFSQDRSQVLLILRRDVPVWVLPGGGIEPLESPEESIIREILEETGFHVKITRLAGVYLPINRLARPTHLYECAIGSGQPSPSSETSAVRFFSINDLPPMPPPYLEWILDARQTQETVHKRIESVNYGAFFKNFLFHPLLVGRFLLSRLGHPFNSR
jgi:ADP-ribose pyrophosphatase YjhB (NUDIX family)